MFGERLSQQEAEMQENDVLVFNGRYSAKVNDDRRKVVKMTPREAWKRGYKFRIEFKVREGESFDFAEHRRWVVKLKTTSREFDDANEALAYCRRYEGTMEEV